MSIIKILVFCFGVSSMACAQSKADKQVPPPADEQIERINALDAQLFPNGIQAGTDTARAFPFIRAVEEFAESNRKDARVPEFLMKAAGVANGLDYGNKSIKLWGFVWRRFPDHPRAPEALFYQGFVMDTRYQDYPNAVQYYERFLKYYPDHEFVEQVKQLLEVAKAGGTVPKAPLNPTN